MGLARGTGDAEVTEIRVTDPITGGQKGVKPERLDLIPVDPLRQLGLVYGHGAAKYPDATIPNYLRGYNWSLSYGAAMRHLRAFWSGENLDLESGLPHLAHLAWHAFALQEFVRLSLGTDDRMARHFLEPQYVAGIVDGEGWVGIIKQLSAKSSEPSPRYTAVVKVSSTDPELLVRLHAAWGGWLGRHSKTKPHHRQAYRWAVQGARAIAMLEAVRPWLVIKARQADTCFALAHIDNWRGDGKGKSGPGHRVPESVLAERDRLYLAIRALNYRARPGETPRDALETVL